MSAGNGASPEQVNSYHGQPVLKPPVWSQEIPVYFYAGGLAGASAGLAWLSELRGNQTLERRAWGAEFDRHIQASLESTNYPSRAGSW